MPVRRGSRYLYCASSTWSWPSRVRARWAKMSRMRPERSSTLTPSSSDSTRICEGESSLSNTARSHSFASMSSFISRTLPSPRKLRGSGVGRFWISMATVSPPAVSTRAASSSMDTSEERSCSSMLAAASPASTARSFLFSIYPFLTGSPCRGLMPQQAVPGHVIGITRIAQRIPGTLAVRLAVWRRKQSNPRLLPPCDDHDAGIRRALCAGRRPSAFRTGEADAPHTDARSKAGKEGLVLLGYPYQISFQRSSARSASSRARCSSWRRRRRRCSASFRSRRCLRRRRR